MKRNDHTTLPFVLATCGVGLGLWLLSAGAWAQEPAPEEAAAKAEDQSTRPNEPETQEDPSNTQEGPSDAQQGPAKAQPPEAAANGPGTAGLRIYVDPETGALTSTPTPEQAQALSRAWAASNRRSTDGLEVFDLPGGGRGVRLDGRFNAATVVRVHEDGSFKWGCIEDPEHLLQHFLEAQPNPLATAPAAADGGSAKQPVEK